MTLGLLAKKIGMTQVFTADGVRVPVTVLQWEENKILQKKTMETDGYTALQVGTGSITEKNVPKGMIGHFKKAGSDPKRTVAEWRVSPDELAKYEVGGVIGLDLLDGAKSVDVSGISKGKGFQGVMKRHNFSGFRATHGTHEYFRHGGSIGCRATPGKVHKGKRMAGHMGDERVTTINVSLYEVRAEERLIFLRGAVPGGKNAIVELTPSTHTAKRMAGLITEAQEKSKNPMKASKAKR